MAALNLPQETLDAVLDDWTTADVPARTQAALRMLECMTLRPLELDAAFIAELKAAGLDEPSIREAANVGFHYNLINRVADAFDFPIPGVKETARLAGMLNISGKVLKGSAADKIWLRDTDGHIRPTEVAIGRKRILSVKGKVEPTLRRAVEAFVVRQWGHTRAEASDIPDDLKPYLKKVALYAYRVVDKDIEALRTAGYCDEMIYEITIVGAMGAALVGLERVFEALYA